MARDQRLRRFVTFALVAGAHGLLLMLPLDAERRERGERAGDAPRTVLFFPRMPVVESSSVRPPVEPALEANVSIELPRAISIAPIDGSSISSGEAAAPAIDWSEEARRAAVAAADRVPVPDPDNCDSTGLADPTLPNCKPKPEFEWAPPRAGFSGGLPYIMVGDRCAIGLGFFGCALGKPPANGDLFEGMDDPDRERSSVPE